jgi:hypothetical protein
MHSQRSQNVSVKAKEGVNQVKSKLMDDEHMLGSRK